MAWWVWLVCLLAGWARAETVAIASVDDWNAFVERSCGAEQQSWNVTLQGNLDFTGLPFHADRHECQQRMHTVPGLL